MTERGSPKTRSSEALRRRGSNHWRRAFLAKLAESSNAKQSAEFVGVPIEDVYKARRQDQGFAAKWRAAMSEGYIELEMELLRRFREGDQEAIGGSKYDFANAIRLLNAHRESAAQAQSVQRSVSAQEVRASIDRKVESIRLKVESEQRRAQAIGK